MFFSYITRLKMALFKSIRHILQAELGHVALLRAGLPPPRFTTLFDFCDSKTLLLSAPRQVLGASLSS